MPHRSTLDRPDAVLHLTGRVNWRVWHLTTPGAFPLFLCVLDRLLDEFGVDLLGFVLMSNHYHMVVRSPAEQQFRSLTTRRTSNRHYRPWPRSHFKSSAIAQFMHKLALTMSKEIQERLDLSGHFWERRYHQSWVRDASDLVVRIAYDHRNPVRQGMAPSPEAYAWSSASTWVAPGSVSPLRLLRRGSLPFGAETESFRAELLRYQTSKLLDDVFEAFSKRRRRLDSDFGQQLMRQLLREAGLDSNFDCASDGAGAAR